MAVYLVKGARDSILGNISDAGPFRVYLNSETDAQQAGTLSGFLVHSIYDDTDSKLEDITIDGITYTDVISKTSLNAGIGLTTSISYNTPSFIFRSVSNCINGFTYIPPSPTPTATVTPSATPSVTPTTSATPSVTPSVTATVTPTVSVTPTISVTTSVTPTATISPSLTPTISVSPSKTPSISVTPSISITPSISTTPGVSPTPSTTPPNSPPNSPPAVATSNGQVTFSGVSRSSSGTITGTVNVSMTSYSVNSHVHVDIYAYGNGGSAIQGSVYYVGNASSVPSNPSDTFSVSDSDWADYANGGGTVTIRATLFLNSDSQDTEYAYLTVPATPATPSPTPTISDTPPASVTPSISGTPPVSPTRSVSKTPPASPPPPRTADTVFGAGSYSCTAACNDYSSTFVWFNGTTIGTGTTLYTSATGTGTLTTGYFSYWDGTDDCWYYSGAAYYQSECCVMEGTMISISSGSSVAVETLTVGDEVMSKNIPSLPDSDEGLSALHSWNSNNINGSSSTAIVTGNSTEIVRGIYNFNNGALYTTHSHSHIIKRNGIWKILKASEVLSGDIYEDVNGDEIEITSIVVEDRDVRIYKLNVETDDVYYANGILTHNYK